MVWFTDHMLCRRKPPVLRVKLRQNGVILYSRITILCVFGCSGRKFSSDFTPPVRPPKRPLFPKQPIQSAESFLPVGFPVKDGNGVSYIRRWIRSITWNCISWTFGSRKHFPSLPLNWSGKLDCNRAILWTQPLSPWLSFLHLGGYVEHLKLDTFWV